MVACDPRRENAESLAGHVEDHFGIRPAVVASLDEVDAGDLQAVDICTDPRFHHTVCADAASRGWDVMTEKPMGLTVRACRLMREATDGAGRILSVAENYRRDPVNRLAKALLDAGVIGTPRYMVHNTAGGSNKMMITVWRHLKNVSGLLLDVGVHFADILEYFMGPVSDIYAQTRLHEQIRYNDMAGKDPATASRNSPAGGLRALAGGDARGIRGDCRRRGLCHADLPERRGLPVPRRARDLRQGILAQGHLRFGGSDGIARGPVRPGVFHCPGRQNHRGRRPPGPRAGLCPGRGDRRAVRRRPPVEIQFPFPETDRKIIAIEYADFAEAIDEGRQPEVDGYMGMRSVAVSYGIMESGQAGRAVTMEEMMADDLGDYQQEINDSLGI